MHYLAAVPLAPRTTLRLGGPARRFVAAESERDIASAIADADARGERVLVLGGGSNLVIGDAGFDGLVVQIASRGVAVARHGDRVRLEVAAGEPWDALVDRCVVEGWSGVECLSGIPGLVGATPIQNVGAYGQEVKQTITAVRAFDRVTGAMVDRAPAACGFGYRSSIFKGHDRYVVVAVTFELAVRGDSAPLTYAELTRALGIEDGGRAPLADVRRVVIGLRRAKGMVLDELDPESVSAGSFFVNPQVNDEGLAALERRIEARLGAAARAPRFAGDDGRHKVSAAWLIERAGFPKGTGEGAVGISRKHALALVNRGGATARELLEFAGRIRRGVEEAFGVELAMEPVIVER